MKSGPGEAASILERSLVVAAWMVGLGRTVETQFRWKDRY